MYTYKVKKFGADYWVVTEKEEIKLAKIANVKHPSAVATMISSSMNSNKKLILIDLI